MSKEVLDTCLAVTGSFENGHPNYQGVAGNSDKQGLSVGVLQWCALQGSLGQLIQRIVAKSSVEAVDSFFGDVSVASLAEADGPSQKQFVVENFLSDGLHVTKQGLSQWQALLSTQEAIDAQVELAEEGVLAKAMTLAGNYVVDGANHLRVVVFFFDLVTQSGGMSNSRGRVDPLVAQDLTYQLAIDMAKLHSTKTATKWASAVETDPLAQVLLHYAYQRALLSRPEFIWDALSRRGSIACRGGVVHGKMFDFTEMLP